LLADNPDVVTWLHPHGDGSFTPESLPEGVFRPLTDWVEYVLDHDRAALQAWVQSHQFDFEPFVCTEDDEKRRDKKKGQAREPRGGRREGQESAAEGAGPDAPAQAAAKKTKAQDSLEPLPELPRAAPNELQAQLRALERHFLDIAG